MPTPDRILRLNRYFSEKIVLIRKNPCNLAGFNRSWKKMQWVTFRRHFPATGALQCPENERSKNRGFKWIFQETGRFQRIFNNNFNNTLGSHKPYRQISGAGDIYYHGDPC